MRVRKREVEGGGGDSFGGQAGKIGKMLQHWTVAFSKDEVQRRMLLGKWWKMGVKGNKICLLEIFVLPLFKDPWKIQVLVTCAYSLAGLL